ncbi:MIP/aquaporin family protein [Spiroplasma endosymbiont of Crioceris asparagi]|uniref:MIP/aquaporin family protein n=1 Tax=Spiroplasma endosymbiont of Crioceris asparagi TaxID=3066286 RepID=UPI0030CBF815
MFLLADASHATIFQFLLSEMIGSLCLVFIGNGTVACYELKKTKGATVTGRNGMNWLGVGIGYGFAVFVGVLCAGSSDHQINPAATLNDIVITIANKLGMSSNHGIKTIYNEVGNLWALWAIGAIVFQIIGAMLAQLLLDGIFILSFRETEDNGKIIAMHSTTRPKTDKSSKSTAIKVAFFEECIGTFFLLFSLKVAFGQLLPTTLAGEKDSTMVLFWFAITAGIIVMLLVISSGSVTGPALNPSRDLGPRIIFALLPLPNKDKNDAEWEYAWVPVFAPLTGGLMCGLLTLAIAAVQ